MECLFLIGDFWSLVTKDRIQIGDSWSLATKLVTSVVTPVINTYGAHPIQVLVHTRSTIPLSLVMVLYTYGASPIQVLVQL